MTTQITIDQLHSFDHGYIGTPVNKYTLRCRKCPQRFGYPYWGPDPTRMSPTEQIEKFGLCRGPMAKCSTCDGAGYYYPEDKEASP